MYQPAFLIALFLIISRCVLYDGRLSEEEGALPVCWSCASKEELMQVNESECPTFALGLHPRFRA